MSAGEKQPKRASLLIATIAVGGAIVVAGTISSAPVALDADLIRRALILIIVSAVAELVAIPLQHGDTAEKLTLFELAVVANVVLLPPSAALVVTIAGQAIALGVHRKGPVKYAFNLGQFALAVTPVIVLFRTAGRGEFLSPAGALSLITGMAIFTAMNFVTISGIISTVTDRPLRSVLAEERGISFAMGIGNSAVGMVAVDLYLTRPELLPAVLAPTVALHMAFKGWVKAKEFSARIEEESIKLGRILEHSTEGIVLADGDGRVLLWSPSMERVTGVGSAEAVGKALAYLLRGRNAYGQSIAIDVMPLADSTEIEIIATDGGVRWLRVQHGPALDERGKVNFDVLVVTDVTRQREVDKLKDDFFSTVSHELRTPLTPIKGYATLLLRRGDDIPPDRRRGALQSIVERTDHMARLVEDLLIASRLANTSERRLPEVNRQPVEVRSVVERALRSFQTAHPVREFRLEAEQDVTVLGDGIRVEQVVANLVSNAVKFSEEGAPVDVIVDVDEQYGRIRVIDEGRGIPSDRYDEIFEKFKRLEDPLVMETGGAGLGLFIVKQLTAAMGGTVMVHSEIGRGSTFTVTLPLVGSAAAASLPPQRRSQDMAG